MSDDNKKDRPHGIRKDGEPYKEGNTRKDGSYKIGKNRPDPSHQFRENDGRKRGVRGKGQKNLMTEWREELAAKVGMTEDGKRIKVSKRRAIIKSSIDRGMRKSDRAAETVLRYAELSEKRDPGLQADDLAIIATWFDSQRVAGNSDDAQEVGRLPHNDGTSGDGVTGDD